MGSKCAHTTPEIQLVKDGESLGSKKGNGGFSSVVTTLDDSTCYDRSIFTQKQNYILPCADLSWTVQKKQKQSMFFQVQRRMQTEICFQMHQPCYLNKLLSCQCPGVDGQLYINSSVHLMYPVERCTSFNTYTMQLSASLCQQWNVSSDKFPLELTVYRFSDGSARFQQEVKG